MIVFRPSLPRTARFVVAAEVLAKDKRDSLRAENCSFILTPQSDPTRKLDWNLTGHFCAGRWNSGTLTSCSGEEIQYGTTSELAAQSPTEHQKSAGDDPASRDANGDERPLATQWDDERTGDRDTNEHGERQAQESQGRAALEGLEPYTAKALRYGS
jgi:hypothetical protein